MLVSAQTLISYLEQLAPRRLAQDWDNVGLQLGSAEGSVKKVLVALDADERVIEEAISAGADFIVTHHPVIFRPLNALRTDLPLGRLLARALSAEIRIFAMHTNLDTAAGGVNDALAGCLDLRDCEVLRVTGRESLEKIVVFVPESHADNVRRAMAAAGAGWIGNYSHCSFQVSGTGTFMPLDGSNPFIGEKGKLEKVEELRVETIVPSTLRKRVVQAMLKAHPYEEAAFDIYALGNEGMPYGFGRIGKNPVTCTLSEYTRFVGERLETKYLRVTGDPDRQIRKVAVCGGAGADLIHAASFAGADVLVTGDVKYHDAREAEAIGFAVIDAGHDNTERLIVPLLCDYLREKISEEKLKTEVFASTVNTAPWRVL